jgi:hypothetical protein
MSLLGGDPALPGGVAEGEDGDAEGDGAADDGPVDGLGSLDTLLLPPGSGVPVPCPQPATRNPASNVASRPAETLI